MRSLCRPSAHLWALSVFFFLQSAPGKTVTLCHGEQGGKFFDEIVAKR
jgi:hypothetical protein